MSPLACHRIARLVDRTAEGLDAAEALEVEEHLAACVSCADDAHLLESVRSAMRDAPGPGSPERMRERAIRRAIRGSGSAESPNTRTGAPTMLAVAALAAAALLAVFAWGGDDTTGGSAAAPEPKVPEVGRDGLAEATTVDETQSTSDQLVLGPATLTFTPDSDYTVRDDGVFLHRGRVSAQVDHLEDGSFRIHTPRFVVEVVGTRFTVDRRSVRVQEGVVRILGRDGSTLVERLGAGGRWTVEHRSEPPRPTTGEPQAAAAEGDRRSAQDWIVLARRQLARGEVARARASAQAARAANASPSRRAEADSLLAECALMTGDRRGAVDAYLETARRYPNLPAAENALFSAARIEVGMGNRSRARGLFGRYLERYPDGRYVEEARRRLRTLGGR